MYRYYLCQFVNQLQVVSHKLVSVTPTSSRTSMAPQESTKHAEKPGQATVKMCVKVCFKRVH